MSFTNLTIQGIENARQRASRNPLLSVSDIRGVQNAQARAVRNPLFTGMSGLGVNFDEATYHQQALRGSVVDATINIGQAWRVLSYTSTLTRQLVDRLNTVGFQVLNADDSNLALLTGGSMRLRVRILTDGYATANDAASVIAGAAAALGYNVTSSNGVLVSSAPSNTGQQVPTSGQAYDPSTTPSANAPSVTDSLSKFFNNLTQSPTTLAVILGAAVVLVIAAKK